MLKFYKEDKNAKDLVKFNDSDIGYDLTIIKEHARYGKTILYDTGIIIEPPNGYYTKIFPRSSLIKTGYIMTNSVGIIDPDYRNTLKIALTKIDDTMEDIKLPFRCAQLVLEKSYPVMVYDVKEEKLVHFSDNSSRGRNGFGSTN